MRRTLVIAAALLAAIVFASTAGAGAPTTETEPGDYSVAFTGADSPCPFDITFTAAGTVTVTTFYDGAGQPTRQAVHGALTHTVFSAWHSLTSNGPAPVHVDLSTGLSVDTGKEFAFHIPGSGVVWAEDGRFVFGDIGVIAYSGLNTFDTAALCAALAP